MADPYFGLRTSPCKASRMVQRALQAKRTRRGHSASPSSSIHTLANLRMTLMRKVRIPSIKQASFLAASPVLSVLEVIRSELTGHPSQFTVPHPNIVTAPSGILHLVGTVGLHEAWLLRLYTATVISGASSSASRKRNSNSTDAWHSGRLTRLGRASGTLGINTSMCQPRILSQATFPTARLR